MNWNFLRHSWHVMQGTLVRPMARPVSPVRRPVIVHGDPPPGPDVSIEKPAHPSAGRKAMGYRHDE